MPETPISCILLTNTCHTRTLTHNPKGKYFKTLAFGGNTGQISSAKSGVTPGSPVPGILQARTLEWVAISFTNA